MKAFDVKTTESDYSMLVIAEDYKQAIETLNEERIYDCDIVSITMLHYSSDHIKIAKEKAKA